MNKSNSIELNATNNDNIYIVFLTDNYTSTGNTTNSVVGVYDDYSDALRVVCELSKEITKEIVDFDDAYGGLNSYFDSDCDTFRVEINGSDLYGEAWIYTTEKNRYDIGDIFIL